jgi:GNAT superfamily N-acetyltransferase
MFERRIEEAALNNWPALQQLLFDGWVIRFAQGYTKRANSVTPLYPSLLSAKEKIAHCERFYEEKHLPTIFRLPSFSTESHALDQLLAQQGYHSLDLTFVWFTELHSDPVADNPALYTIPLATWFSIYRQFSTHYIELQHLHRELLERIPPPLMYAALYVQGAPVACGLGVLEHEVFGIFDVVTDPEQRRKGYGTQLVTGMLAWGKQHGAQYAYLQVMDTNQIAQQMYTKLGFQPCYQYWYRVQAQ